MELNCNHYFIDLEPGRIPLGYLHLYHKNYDDDKQVYFDYLFVDEIGTHNLMKEVNNSNFFVLERYDYSYTKDIIINDFITIKILRNEYRSTVILELKDQIVRICSHKGRELREEKKTLTYLIKTRYFDLANKTYDRYTPGIQTEIDLYMHRKYHKEDEEFKEVENYLQRKVWDCEDFSRVEFVHEDED